MTLTYSRLFGLDEPERGIRLQCAGLTPPDQPVAAKLQRVLLAETAQALAAALARELRTLPEYLPWTGDEADRVAFERRMMRFLLDFGPAFEDPRWFEERLRDTLGWARAGLRLSSYVCMMGRLQRLVLEALESGDGLCDATEVDALREVALKLFTLELSLAGDSYQLVHTDDFSDAVDLLKAELTVDSLTRVSNRQHLLTTLKMKLRAAANNRLPLCLILADLDYFKRVNDEFGHPAGDAVLRAVTERMRATLREADMVGRLGGEEFAIVLEGTELPGARILAERIRERVAEKPCEHGDAQILVTLSQGIAEFTGDESLEALMARADAALYAAKRAGRNRVSLQDGRRGLTLVVAGDIATGPESNLPSLQ